MYFGMVYVRDFTLPFVSHIRILRRNIIIGDPYHNFSFVSNYR